MLGIVIVGAGGLGREVAWLIEDINKLANRWNLLGFVDDDSSIHGHVINDYPVLGGLHWLKAQQLNVVIAIGNPLARKSVLDSIKGSLNTYPILIHPSSIISPRASLDCGVVVRAGNIIGVDTVLGKHSFVGPACTIGHDAIIGACSVLMPGVNVSGNVQLEQCVSVGTGAVIIQGITVGARTTIGAGAVVVRNLPPDCTAVGAPAKPIKFHS